jgi:hypothetical protein
MLFDDVHAPRAFYETRILRPAKQVVALFNASDDTVKVVQRILEASHFNCLAGRHFRRSQERPHVFGQYLAQPDPDVAVNDVSPPRGQIRPNQDVQRGCGVLSGNCFHTCVSCLPDVASSNPRAVSRQPWSSRSTQIQLFCLLSNRTHAQEQERLSRLESLHSPSLSLI